MSQKANALQKPKTSLNPPSALSFRPLLLVFFFLSGACGLVYEVAWLRVMGLIFGNTTFAISTVLAGYMAGLGLGALFFGQWIDRKGNPIKVYGFLEGGVALYAFMTPLVWKLIDLIHIQFFRHFEPSFLTFSLFKFVVSFIALFIPTFLMGGTLPVLTRFIVQHQRETARGIGLLYALNTLGAVFGVLFTGYYALYAIGVWQTVIWTGVFNSLICASCWLVSKRVKPEQVSQGTVAVSENTANASATSPALSHPGVALLLLILFGVSGAVSMMYEVGWTRVLAIVLGSSVFAFSVMLATFLLGIAVGSYVFSLLSKYMPVGLRTFAVLELLTAFFALLGLNQFDDMPYEFAKIYQWSAGSVFHIELGKFALCNLVMLPPTLCIGAMFACFIHIYQHSQALGKEVGVAYFSNTIGTIFGSAFTGFLIVPAIGIQNTLLLAAALNATIGVIIFLIHPRTLSLRSWMVGGVMCGLVGLGYARVEPWNKSLITSGVVVKPFNVAKLTKKQFAESLREKQSLFYKEGSSGTVSVDRVKDNVSLAINGKVDASNEDAFNQFLAGHLPMMFVPKADDVLVIGVGSASTVAAVAAFPVKKIDVVELEAAVIQGARFFSRLNRNVLDDPRVNIEINDGRNFVLIHEKLYDVIVSEPSNPWMAGIANLFSLEHYQTMSKRLKPGGVVCQWLHAYSMSTEDVRMILRTFSLAFKNISLWTSYYPDLLLIGSNEPYTIDMDRVRQVLEIPAVKKDLWPHGIREPESFLGSFWLGDQEIRALSAGARVNSDNRPYLEFSAPRNLYHDTLQQNFNYLNSYRRWDYPPLVHLDPPIDKNARFHAAVGRGLIAKRMFAQVQQSLERAKTIDPEDPTYLEVWGILSFKDGRYDEAQQFLTKAVTINPSSAEAHDYLAMTYEKKGDFAATFPEYQKTVELAPEDPFYLSQLANTYFDRKEYGPARKLYEKILEIRGDHFDSLLKLSDIIFLTGDLKEQIDISERFIERYPRFNPMYDRLAHTYENAGMFDKSFQVFELLTKNKPDDPHGYLNMARLYDRLGTVDDVKRAIRKAIHADPSLASNTDIQKLLNQ